MLLLTQISMRSCWLGGMKGTRKESVWVDDGGNGRCIMRTGSIRKIKAAIQMSKERVYVEMRGVGRFHVTVN